jgi:hypothetical protein
MEWQKVLGRIKGELSLRSQASAPALSTTIRSTEERKAILQQKIIQHVGIGYKVETQTDFQVVLSHGGKVNHIMHLLLSIVTFGFWLIVWLLIAMFSRKKFITLSVDQFGNTHFAGK